MFVVMSGLPASGKSTIARMLQQRLSAVLLDKDALRAFLFGEYTEYSREQDDLCMESVYSTAGFLVRKHSNLIVILDGRTYSRSYQIKAVHAAAAKAGTQIRMIECVCSEWSAKQRLDSANSQGLHPAADRDFALYQHSRARAEAIPEPKLVIDTDTATPEDCTEAALEYVYAES